MCCIIWSVVKTDCFTVSFRCTLTKGGDGVAVNPDITILLDIYGEMLTQKERDTLDYYYNEDLSLKEIADNETAARRMKRDMGFASDEAAERDTITRQGVRDTIKRAEKKLIDIDSKLHLSEKAAVLEERLERLEKSVRAIDDFNRVHGWSREIKDNILIIDGVISELREDI